MKRSAITCGLFRAAAAGVCGRTVVGLPFASVSAPGTVFGVSGGIAAQSCSASPLLAAGQHYQLFATQTRWGGSRKKAKTSSPARKKKPAVQKKKAAPKKSARKTAAKKTNKNKKKSAVTRRRRTTREEATPDQLDEVLAKLTTGPQGADVVPTGSPSAPGAPPTAAAHDSFMAGVASSMGARAVTDSKSPSTAVPAAGAQQSPQQSQSKGTAQASSATASEKQSVIAHASASKATTEAPAIDADTAAGEEIKHSFMAKAEASTTRSDPEIPVPFEDVDGAELRHGSAGGSGSDGPASGARGPAAPTPAASTSSSDKREGSSSGHGLY